MTTIDDRPRCRICNKLVRVTLDGLVGSHQAKGTCCPGMRRPPAGDPPCGGRGCGGFGGHVSWPEDLRPAAGEPSASTYVCDRPEHRAEAAEWVRSITGHEGVFVPLRRMAGV